MWVLKTEAAALELLFLHPSLTCLSHPVFLTVGPKAVAALWVLVEVGAVTVAAVFYTGNTQCPFLVCAYGLVLAVLSVN